MFHSEQRADGRGGLRGPETGKGGGTGEDHLRGILRGPKTGEKETETETETERERERERERETERDRERQRETEKEICVSSASHFVCWINNKLHSLGNPLY